MAGQRRAEPEFAEPVEYHGARYAEVFFAVGIQKPVHMWRRVPERNTDGGLVLQGVVEGITVFAADLYETLVEPQHMDDGCGGKPVPEFNLFKWPEFVVEVHAYGRLASLA